ARRASEFFPSEANSAGGTPRRAPSRADCIVWWISFRHQVPIRVLFIRDVHHSLAATANKVTLKATVPRISGFDTDFQPGLPAELHLRSEALPSGPGWIRVRYLSEEV